MSLKLLYFLKMLLESTQARNFLYLVISLNLLQRVTSEGFYKVIGPRIIRPNSEFHVAVSTYDVSLPTLVGVTIVGTTIHGKAYSVEETATVLPFSVHIIRLKIDDIEDGVYKLVARGSGGIQFQSSTTLDYLKKSYSVLVQTDKSIYSPGAKVLFRALILNSDLKPAVEARSISVSVFISDSKGNRVKQWSPVHAPNGVFAEEMQLSRHLNFGNWNISVEIHGQTYNKTFLVAEYILPKIKIVIDAPKHLTFRDNILTANIKASYESGRKVVGEATITVYPNIYSGVIQPIFQNPVRKVYSINGALSVNFDIAKELKLSDEYERTIVVDVAIEEALTERRQNNSVEVQLHKYDYKMELIKTANYFKPGLLYTFYIKVTNHDLSAIPNDRRTVTIRYGFSRVDEVFTTQKIVLDRSGMFKFDVETPQNANNMTALRVDAEYYDLKERLPPVPAAVSFSNNYMQLIVHTEKLVVNQYIDIVANCTEPTQYISYVLIGRGDVIIGNTITANGTMKEFPFHFLATHSMVPISHLLVSYIRSDGEMVSDEIDIHIEGTVQNVVELQSNYVEAFPGTDIELTIRGLPNSYIGLMAIDEEANKMRMGHDINEDVINSELQNYDLTNTSPYWAILKDRKRNYIWKQGSSNARDMFDFSGATLMTNSFVISRRPTLDDIYLRPVHYDASTVKPDRGVGLPLYSVTRPPLAGPYAFSHIPKPVWNRPKVYLLNPIADTWLFNNFSSGVDGRASIRRRIPDTIGTWSITAFSLSPVYGLGVISLPKKIKVSKLLAISIEIPQAVQRGEIVQVLVVTMNNQDKDITVEVTLHNPEQKFTFAEMSNEINGTVKKVELFQRKRVSVKPQNTGYVAFSIVPTRIGDVELKATASSSSNQDTNIKTLIVRGEGETLHFTKSIFIDLARWNTFSSNLTIDIPKNVVPNTENIRVSVVGDLLGPTLSNLDHLIHLPTVSGEQNLVHFIPNLIALKYMEKMQIVTPNIRNKAIRNLETSYQQQLTYRTKKGGFGLYGNENESSSLWITAYTAAAFTFGQKYIYINPDVITSAYDFLASKQSRNGSFVEHLPIVHKDLQSRNDKSLTLTAFVTLSFRAFHRFDARYTNTINKAVDYIARNLGEEDTAYTIAICAYVFLESKHPRQRDVLNLLDSKIQGNGTRKWWGNRVPMKEENNPWHMLPKSSDIEATSYALLAYLHASVFDEVTPAFDWLNDQRNNLGGFIGTHDTVVGLYALYKIALTRNQSTNCQIEFGYRKQETLKLNVNADNAMIVQTTQLGANAREINVTASGSGYALFQLSYDYNMNVTGPLPLFTLDPQVDKNSDQHHLQLSICTAFGSRNLTQTSESNMAVMEVNLPSGFTVNRDALPSLEESQNVQKVDTENMDTKVILYFNNLTTNEVCPTISAFQTHKVANQKPVPVIIYDYYDNSRRARIFYNVRRLTFCDICEDNECRNACVAEIGRQRAEEAPSKNKNADKIGTGNTAPPYTLGFTTLLVTISVHFNI